MNSGYPIWAAWLKDFGSIIIAVVALIVTAWIQFGQSRTSKTKLKLDLFEQRFGIFAVLDKIRRTVMSAQGIEWVGEYISEMSKAVEELRRYRLLFPAHIGTEVDNIVNAWHDFATLKAEGEALTRPSEEWTKNIKGRRELWEKIGKSDEALRKKIEEFIRVNWRG